MKEHQIITTNKSISLPRINQRNQSIKSMKPFKAFHKVKWSINPKCLIEGHDGKQIICICIHANCQHETRFACEECLLGNHSKHKNEFISIDQIKRGSITKLKSWPFEHKYRKIFQFVTKHESYVANMVQDVNATFNEMAMNILNTIDKIRLNLLKTIDNFYLKETIKQSFSNKVKQQLEECFQMRQLRQVVRQIFSKQIRLNIFAERINNILNNQTNAYKRQKLLQFFEQAQKGKDMVFDKMYFLKKQNWIIQQIDQQKNSLKQTQVIIDEFEFGIEKMIPQTLTYLKKSAMDYNNLTFETKIVEDGSEYVGFMSQGKRVLIGMRNYLNGYVYYGEWKLNAKNGWGISENKQKGYKYMGQWKNDKKNGYGRQQTLTTTYQGNFFNDKKEGFGVFIQNGIRDEINWKNDKRHGQGKRIQKNGMERQIYYLNGVESNMKVSKSNAIIDLKALSKRFSSTTKLPPS